MRVCQPSKRSGGRPPTWDGRAAGRRRAWVKGPAVALAEPPRIRRLREDIHDCVGRRIARREDSPDRRDASELVAESAHPDVHVEVADATAPIWAAIRQRAPLTISPRFCRAARRGFTRVECTTVRASSSESGQGRGYVRVAVPRTTRARVLRPETPVDECLALPLGPSRRHGLCPATPTFSGPRASSV